MIPVVNEHAILISSQLLERGMYIFVVNIRDCGINATFHRGCASYLSVSGIMVVIISRKQAVGRVEGQSMVVVALRRCWNMAVVDQHVVVGVAE